MPQVFRSSQFSFVSLKVLFIFFTLSSRVLYFNCFSHPFLFLSVKTTFLRRLKHFSKEIICLSLSTVSLPIMTIGSLHLNQKPMHSR